MFNPPNTQTRTNKNQSRLFGFNKNKSNNSKHLISSIQNQSCPFLAFTNYRKDSVTTDVKTLVIKSQRQVSNINDKTQMQQQVKYQKYEQYPTKKSHRRNIKHMMYQKRTKKIVTQNNISEIPTQMKVKKTTQIYKFPFFYQQHSEHHLEKQRAKTLGLRRFSLQKNRSTIQEKNKEKEISFLGLEVKKYDLVQKIQKFSEQPKQFKLIHSPKLRPRQIQKKIFHSVKINNSSTSSTYNKILGFKDLFQEKADKYRQFLFKLYFSNSTYLSVCPISDKFDKKNQIKYQAYIGSGNNFHLIKKLLKKRWWWTVVNEYNSQTQFIWTQSKQSWFINSQKKQQKYTIKQGKILLKIQIQKKQQDRDTIKLMHKKDKIIYDNYLTLVQKHQPNEFKERFNLIQKNPVNKLFSFQKVHNHFEFNQIMGNKKALLKNMINYYDYKKINIEKYSIPRTFHIINTRDVQMNRFLSFYKHKQQQKLTNIWIIKPGQNSNRGQGIKVCRNLNQISNILKDKSRTHIVQQYLSDLLLYYKRKFDIRTYLLMTQVNGILKAYWYQDGYIRTSSELYRLDDLNDPLIHLTNDAVQKYGINYGRFQPGNKISYYELQKYLDSQGNQAKWEVSKLVVQMKKIAAEAVFASYPRIDPNCRQNNFEIFGLDFIIDKNFRPWLLQINTNPCLQLSSIVLARIIPRMVENAFKIALDPLFPPTACPYTSKPYFTDNCSQSNKFELIFDSQYDRIIDYQNKCEKDEQKYEQQNDTYSNDGNE